jgi:hypothetical protein
MYALHPSPELNALFARKPFQGVPPALATYLFVGLDANYDAKIEQSPIFPKLLEYHEDGVAFWHRYNVHHPFLLPQYSGDGRRYHQSFAHIGFGPNHGHLVSFLELLHLPTVGTNKLVPQDLAASHLKLVNSAIREGQARHIFISAGVARLMRATGVFPWLPDAPRGNVGALGVLFREGGRTVYSHLHFSVYGKFQKRKMEEAATIRGLLGLEVVSV